MLDVLLEKVIICRLEKLKITRKHWNVYLNINKFSKCKIFIDIVLYSHLNYFCRQQQMNWKPKLGSAIVKVQMMSWCRRRLLQQLVEGEQQPIHQQVK
jgi:hypothetical protein